jgi:two-component system NarL family sensor kinase
MSQVAYFILGTSSMILMIIAIIWFVYIYQRKLAAKVKAYAEIEKLVQTQVLQSAYSLIEGQELERKRIAAELHDNIGGLLATLKIYSDLALTKSELPDIQRLNTKVNNLSEQLSGEVRKLSHELDLRTLSGFGFKVAVQQLCEAINESGKLSIIAVIDVHKPFNDAISLNLYRIIQELFTNTLKHAGASRARIEVSLIGGDISMIYEDNGKGFDSQQLSPGGMGLQNIRHRTSLINGRMTIDSSERGTTYIIELSDHE